MMGRGAPGSPGNGAGRATADAGDRGQRWARIGRLAFILGVVVWLAYKLSGIGWLQVWESRPRTPWFYVVWLALYLQLPLVEALIFRAVWRVPLRESFVPLLQKRTLNQDVVSGLGEVFLFSWARRHLALKDGQIAGTLKDNVIASSLASWTSLVLLVLLASPVLVAPFVAASDPLYLAAGALVIALLVALGVRFRRTVFTLRPGTVLAIFGAHVGRFGLLVYALQILQWRVVAPEAPFSLLVPMLVVVMAVNRIPFIPARDLVGIGAVFGVVSLPPTLRATVAAMLLLRSALDKSCNLAFFLADAAMKRSRKAAASAAPCAPKPGGGKEP